MEQQAEVSTQSRHGTWRYRCVVGHDIPAVDLESLTAIRSLDEGAEVRVCVEHGAPIAMRRD
jgi:hypothetical protein